MAARAHQVRKKTRDKKGDRENKWQEPSLKVAKPDTSTSWSSSAIIAAAVGGPTTVVEANAAAQTTAAIPSTRRWRSGADIVAAFALLDICLARCHIASRSCRGRACLVASDPCLAGEDEAPATATGGATAIASCNWRSCGARTADSGTTWPGWTDSCSQGLPG